MPRINTSFIKDPISFDDDTSERYMRPFRENAFNMAQMLMQGAPELRMQTEQHNAALENASYQRDRQTRMDSSTIEHQRAMEAAAQDRISKEKPNRLQHVQQPIYKDGQIVGYKTGWFDPVTGEEHWRGEGGTAGAAGKGAGTAGATTPAMSMPVAEQKTLAGEAHPDTRYLTDAMRMRTSTAVAGQASELVLKASPGVRAARAAAMVPNPKMGVTAGIAPATEAADMSRLATAGTDAKAALAAAQAAEQQAVAARAAAASIGDTAAIQQAEAAILDAQRAGMRAADDAAIAAQHLKALQPAGAVQRAANWMGVARPSTGIGGLAKLGRGVARVAGAPLEAVSGVAQIVKAAGGGAGFADAIAPYALGSGVSAAPVQSTQGFRPDASLSDPVARDTDVRQRALQALSELTETGLIYGSNMDSPLTADWFGEGGVKETDTNRKAGTVANAIWAAGSGLLPNESVADTLQRIELARQEQNPGKMRDIVLMFMRTIQARVTHSQAQPGTAEAARMVLDDGTLSPTIPSRNSPH